MNFDCIYCSSIHILNRMYFIATALQVQFYSQQVFLSVRYRYQQPQPTESRSQWLGPTILYNAASTRSIFSATFFANATISWLPIMESAATGSMTMTAVLPS